MIDLLPESEFGSGELQDTLRRRTNPSSKRPTQMQAAIESPFR